MICGFGGVAAGAESRHKFGVREGGWRVKCTRPRVRVMEGDRGAYIATAIARAYEPAHPFLVCHVHAPPPTHFLREIL